MEIQKIDFQPNHKAPGRWLLDVSLAPLPKDFVVEKQAIVSIAKGQFAGNHKHAKNEVLMSLQKGLVFVWEDSNGQRHEEDMSPSEGLRLFVISPFVPHVVLNKTDQTVFLYEWGDSTDLTTEKVKLV